VAVAGKAGGVTAVGGTVMGVFVPGTTTGTVAVMGAIAVNWADTVWAAAVMAVFESGFFEGRLQAESIRIADRIIETVRGVFFISLLLWIFNVNSTASKPCGVSPAFLSEKRTPPKN
jgi:hypothetical protein